MLVVSRFNVVGGQCVASRRVESGRLGCAVCVLAGVDCTKNNLVNIVNLHTTVTQVYL